MGDLLKIKKALEEDEGLRYSRKELKVLVCDFNNFNHPISLKTKMILEDSATYLQFLNYILL